MLGSHSCGQRMLLAAEEAISCWHAKKSETEVRMFSRTRTKCSFLTSCCDSDKCHQLVTKKSFHTTEAKNQGFVLVLFENSFLFFPLTSSHLSCTFPAACSLCLVAADRCSASWDLMQEESLLQWSWQQSRVCLWLSCKARLSRAVEGLG